MKWWYPILHDLNLFSSLSLAGVDGYTYSEISHFLAPSRAGSTLDEANPVFHVRHGLAREISQTRTPHPACLAWNPLLCGDTFHAVKLLQKAGLE